MDYTPINVAQAQPRIDRDRWAGVTRAEIRASVGHHRQMVEAEARRPKPKGTRK